VPNFRLCLLSVEHGMQWDCSGSLVMLEYKEMRSPTSLQGAALFWGFLDLRVSRQDIWRKISRWLVNQHCARWWGLGDTQRQARELISGPFLSAKARLLSFNRTQSRAVTGLLTGYNTLRRHLHLLGLPDSPLCRRCGVKEETSAHSLYECEALASFRHTYLGSFI